MLPPQMVPSVCLPQEGNASGPAPACELSPPAARRAPPSGTSSGAPPMPAFSDSRNGAAACPPASSSPAFAVGPAPAPPASAVAPPAPALPAGWRVGSATESLSLVQLGASAQHSATPSVKVRMGFGAPPTAQGYNGNAGTDHPRRAVWSTPLDRQRRSSGRSNNSERR